MRAVNVYVSLFSFLCAYKCVYAYHGMCVSVCARARVYVCVCVCVCVCVHVNPYRGAMTRHRFLSSSCFNLHLKKQSCKYFANGSCIFKKRFILSQIGSNANQCLIDSKLIKVNSELPIPLQNNNIVTHFECTNWVFNKLGDIQCTVIFILAILLNILSYQNKQQINKTFDFFFSYLTWEMISNMVD